MDGAHLPSLWNLIHGFQQIGLFWAYEECFAASVDREDSAKAQHWAFSLFPFPKRERGIIFSRRKGMRHRGMGMKQPFKRIPTGRHKTCFFFFLGEYGYNGRRWGKGLIGQGIFWTEDENANKKRKGKKEENSFFSFFQGFFRADG